MSKTGINFEPCNVVSAQLHNERDADYLESVKASGKATYELFSDRTELNTTWNNPAYLGESLEQILDSCRERYREHVRQEPQENDRVRKVKDKKTGLYKVVRTAGWSPIREGICPVKEDTTLDDFAPVTDWLEEHGVHVISISLHRDEGYEDPVTGERKYNNHGHVIVDWTDHATGRTAKLTAEHMSQLNQVVLPAALGMEPGTAKTVTGAKHLTPQQQREKKARENAALLEAKAAQLQEENDRAQRSAEKAQQREAAALEKAEAAEKAASREQLRSNAADVGARVLGLFGRGAVAEANERAEEAVQQAATDRKVRETAEKAAENAKKAQLAAEETARKAKAEKDAYGRERYEAGHTEGYTAGRLSMKESIAPLQSQLAEKQATIDRLQNSRDERLEKATADANARALAAEQEVSDMQKWNPSMLNWQQSLKDMQAAGMANSDIKKVFTKSINTVQINIKHNYKDYPVETTVAIGGNKGTFGVWFKAAFDDTWHGVSTFLEKAKQYIQQLHPSRGPRL